MEREVGGGIGMGNTCKPMAVSFQCMTKSTTNKKKRQMGNYYTVLLNMEVSADSERLWTWSASSLCGEVSLRKTLEK